MGEVLHSSLVIDRLERVDLSCKYTKVKIAGTLMCLIGALAISFLHGSPTLKSSNNSPPDTFQKHRLMGCMYLIAAVVIVSFTMVLQAATMKKFPTPLTLCTVTSYIGSLLSGVVQFINEGTLETGSKVMSLETLVLFALVTTIGGGGGDIGKRNSHGGGDGGDDDDYFGEFEGDEGGLFQRRLILQELFDKKFVDAVLQEWYKTMMDLPVGLC